MPSSYGTVVALGPDGSVVVAVLESTGRTNRIACTRAESLAQTSIELGDRVLVRRYPGEPSVIVWRSPTFRGAEEEVPAPGATREMLIRRGVLRPAGTFTPEPLPPLEGVGVLRIDDDGRKAAEARVAAGGVDRDFYREWDR